MKTCKILISAFFLLCNIAMYSQEHRVFDKKMPEGTRALFQTMQLSNGGISASDLVRTILPPETPFSNVQFNGPGGLGIFRGASLINLALDEGAVFGCGCIDQLRYGGSQCDVLGVPGDAQLDNLRPGYYYSNDAAYLEFDFVPAFATLEFHVIYGTAEQSDYYGEPSGIFLDGNNIAFIPESNDEISNLMLWNSPFYHENNDIGTILYMYSDVIPVTANLTPNVTHHLKIAISDSYDRVVPSFLFIEGDVNIEAVPVSWWSIVIAMGLILSIVAYRFFAIHRG